MTAWAAAEDVPLSCYRRTGVASSAGPKCCEHWTEQGISHPELNTGTYNGLTGDPDPLLVAACPNAEDGAEYCSEGSSMTLYIREV